MALYGEDDKGVGSVYGHDPRAAEGYTANIGPATSPLSTVAFVDATGNPYETNQTKYNELVTEFQAMLRNHPELKDKMNLTSVDQNNRPSIEAALANVKALVKEQEEKEIKEAMAKVLVGAVGLAVGAEAASGMGGKSPMGNMMGAEMAMTQQQKANNEEEAKRHPVDPKREGLLASLTPQQREAHIKHGITDGKDIPETAFFTDIKPMQSPGITKQPERDRNEGYSRSLAG